MTAKRRPGPATPADRAAGVQRGPWTGFVFTGVAGFVDVTGYLALRHVFTANMSGNSIAVGSRLADGDWQRAWERGLPVAVFFVGLLVGGGLMEAARLCKVRSMLAFALAIEGACLAAFVACCALLGGARPALPSGPPWVFGILVSLAALAMGLQNASLTKMGRLTIHTTHVTGTLTRLAEEFVALGFWWRARTRGRTRGRAWQALRVGLRRQGTREAFGLAGLWGGYVAGAAAGTLGWRAVGLWAMAAPALVVLLMALANRRR